MTKTTPDQMLEDIGTDLIFYLKRGFYYKSGCDKLNLNFSQADFIKLLRIQFLFQDDVLNFLDVLKKETRRIKHSSVFNLIKTDRIKGGSINWQQTINLRAKEGFVHKNIFAVVEPEKNFEIQENLVLMKLLQNLRSSFNEIDFAIRESYFWTQKIRNTKLWEKFRFVFYKNPYLRHLRQIEVQLNSRIIQNVKKSRRKLYKHAAYLQDKFQALQKNIFMEKDLSQFLKVFIVNPDQVSVLFELYWIIQILKVFKNQQRFQTSIQTPKDHHTNLIAKWEIGNSFYQIFHNSFGNGTFFLERAKFDDLLQDFNKLSMRYFYRYYSAVKKKQELIRSVFNDGSLKKNEFLRAGRPDILIEAYDSDTLLLEKILIAEVKYTRDQKYIYEGLEQLLTYMALIRRNDSKEYVLSKVPISSDLSVSGILFVEKLQHDNITDINTELEDIGEPIRIFEYNQDLTKFLEEFAGFMK